MSFETPNYRLVRNTINDDTQEVVSDTSGNFGILDEIIKGIDDRSVDSDEAIQELRPELEQAKDDIERLTDQGNMSEGRLDVVESDVDLMEEEILDHEGRINSLDSEVSGYSQAIKDVEDIVDKVYENDQSQDNRIDNIVSQAGDDNTEIVDARHDNINDVTFPTLGKRIDNLSRTPKVEYFEGDGSTDTFELQGGEYEPGKNVLQVRIGGAVQEVGNVEEINSTQFRVSEAPPEGMVIEARYIQPYIPIVAGVSIKELSDYQTEVVDKFGEVIEKVKSMVINVKEYGAIGDAILPDGSLNPNPTDNTEAFQEALLDAPNHRYTLLIPYGAYYVEGRIEIQCNVECQGEMIIPNTISDSSIVFPAEEVLRFQGDEVLGSVEAGDNSLDILGIPGIPRNRLSDYNYRIESTEKLITRLGNRYTENHAYTKNESGQIKRVDEENIYTRSKILYSYNNLGDLEFILTKKLPFLEVNNLKIRRISRGSNNPDQNILTIRRNNMIFNNTYINNEVLDTVKRGIYLDRVSDIIFKGLEILSIYGDGYPIENTNSSFIYFNDYKYREVENPSQIERGYAARHGNHIYFRDCDLYGIDDHYGSNYFIEGSSMDGRGVSFAGHNLTIKNTKFSNIEWPIRNRVDTPHNTGKLILDNVDFDNCVYGIFHQIANDDDKELGFDPSFYDEIIIKDVNYLNPADGGVGLLRINSSTEGRPNTDYTVSIGKITLRNVESESPLIYLPNTYKVDIGQINIKDCDVVDLMGSAGIYTTGNIGNHNIDRIIIKDSDNITLRFSSTVSCPDIRVYDSVYDENAAHTFNQETRVEFNNTRFENNASISTGSSAVFILKNNMFMGPYTDDFINNQSRIVYSSKNISDADIDQGYLPELTGYVNENYFITGEPEPDPDPEP